MFSNFKEAAQRSCKWPLQLDNLKTLQMNLGNLCNQKCGHCHMEAGPDGNKIMPEAVMLSIIEFMKDYIVPITDLTGGCPELNPHFRYFIDALRPLAAEIKIRTNLTVICEPGMEWLPEFYKKYNLVLVGSLPCYTKQNADIQRGHGSFEKSIKALQSLNGIGYGIVPGLELNLVYNPIFAVLPGAQSQLEADYREHLHNEHGIVFNKFYTMTNAPIGRFRESLQTSGDMDEYSNLLKTYFNPQTLANIMCRNLLSVDYQGFIYNCDFNMALNRAITCNNLPLHISRLKEALMETIEIVMGEHCFACTAGAGSSCTGVLAKAS